MTETPVAVTWQPKTTAGRDMILLVLSQQDGVVRDEKGFVTARMVELCGIPDTPNNRSMISNVLKLMEQDGYIIRDTRENKRTYEVVLETPVSEGRLEELRAALARNQKFFETPEQDVATPDDDSVHPDPTLARLITDCTRGLTVIQGAADKATRQTDAGRVVISVTGALRSIGIKGQWAREIRYYLRNLGLAKAIRKCEEDDKMWWWEVSDKSVNADALVALATGDDSFPNHLARQGKTYVEDGARERAFAGRAPAVLPSSLCSPVTVRKIGEPKEGSATPPPAEPAPSTDQIAALVRIIKGLEAQLASLRESHDATVAKMNADHAAELDKLQRQIDELKEAQASAAKVDADAADVIARHAELL